MAMTKDQAEDLGHQNRKLSGDLVVGFTGTRRGMTRFQRNAVASFLRDVHAVLGRHGDCVGADEEFHSLCISYRVPVIIHPPEDDRLRAFCEGAMKVEQPKPYLVRDQIIVNKCDILIAAPKEEREPPPARGQGTWATIRYARKSRRLVRIVWPE